MIREEDGSDKAQDKGQARLNRGTDFAVEFWHLTSGWCLDRH